ncbi:hypothetical protein ACFYKX_13570 [Cytobacillus sp. FJAT-54145]|uniref:Uncharacterized protein n=1 Tax=Cytobacillus spartinae TaxID=3299023 RepID=A0ABW6KG06_9BACI
MTKEQILSAFDACGLGKLGEELGYKLWVNGALKECDEETLELFLESYDFKEGQAMLLHHFLFHFRMFKRVHDHNNLPLSYLSFRR